MLEICFVVSDWGPLDVGANDDTVNTKEHTRH